MGLVVSVIGAGSIGGDVIRHVRKTPDLHLGRVLTRGGTPDTASIDAFLATPADVIVDAAGPEALRTYGSACLARANLWSVGAAALVDEALREDLRAAARLAGTQLRLFSPWAFGIGTAPAAAVSGLSLRITRTGDEPAWSGPLAEAARLFPGEVNFAVAAALNGPGIARTQIELATSHSPNTHKIETECVTEAGTYRSSVDLTLQARHPTALCLIAALETLALPVGYG